MNEEITRPTDKQVADTLQAMEAIHSRDAEPDSEETAPHIKILHAWLNRGTQERPK